MKQEQLRKQKEEKRKLQLETENKYFKSVREKMNSLKAKIYHCTSEDGRVLFYKSQRIVGDKTTRVNKFEKPKLLYQNFYTNYTDEQKVVARNTLTKQLLVTHNTLLSTNFYTELVSRNTRILQKQVYNRLVNDCATLITNAKRQRKLQNNIVKKCKKFYTHQRCK